jgi:threonyl-tRNA synthetase
LTLAEGATVYDVAAQIGPGLARAAIGGAITVNGARTLTDVGAPLPGDCQVELLTANDENADSLYLLRHSAAHVMAEAICSLFPDTQLAYGPPLEDGFYYDLHTEHAISPEDFARIESEMQRIVSEKRLSPATPCRAATRCRSFRRRATALRWTTPCGPRATN